MGFGQNLLSIFKSSNDTNVITARAPFFQKAMLNEFSGKGNPDVNLKNAELISCVFLCCKIIAENISRLPVEIWQVDGTGKKTLNKQHEYYYTLRFNPKPYQSYQNWISTTITHLFLRGNAYSYIRPDGTFEIIHPDSVINASIVGDTLWYLVETPDQNNPNGVTENVIRYSDLLHFKLISKNGLFGLNPIDSLRTEINTDFKSQKTVENFFSQNAQTTKYLQSQADMGKMANTKIAEMVQRFQEDIAGYQNAGQVWVAPLGMDLKELSLYPETVQFLDASKFSKATIASVFGIPLYLLNEFNYTSKYEEQQLGFLQNLQGVLNIIRCELENKLLTQSEKVNGTTIEFDTKRIAETNLTDRVNAYKTLYMMGALSPQDIQREFNLVQSDDPNMKLHFIQSQNIPIEYVTPELVNKAPVQNNNTNVNEQKENEN